MAKRKYPDRESVVAEVLRRVDLKIPVDQTSLCRRNGEYGDEVLYNWGVEYFESWDAVIVAAGLDPSESKKRPRKKYVDGGAVVSEILRRGGNGLALNKKGVSEGPERDASLYANGRNFFGSWRKAIEAAGLHYSKICQKRCSEDGGVLYPDKGAVVAEIRRRAKHGIPINTSGVSVGQQGDASLHCRAREYFGSWKHAVNAAGFDYEQVVREARRAGRKKVAPREGRYSDGVAVLAEIGRRVNAGVAVNTQSLHVGEHADCMLYYFGQKYFGSWKAAIEKAGLDYGEIVLVRKRSYPEAEDVISAIRQRVEEGKPLHRSALDGGRDRDPSLKRCAEHHFGSWDSALECAGLDAAKIRTQAMGVIYSSPEMVLDKIRELVGDGRPVHAVAVGRSVKGNKHKTLYHRGRCFFGNWKAAVESAGFIYEDLVPKPERKYAGGDDVVAEILRRRDVGLPINAAGVSLGQDRDGLLFQRAVEYHGSWGSAVEAAGICYKSVKAMARPPGTRFKQYKYADENAVVGAIQQRVRQGYPLNPAALCGGKQADKALYSRGRTLFGSWREAVLAAGLSEENLKPRAWGRYPTGKSVIEEIRRRYRKGVGINYAAVVGEQNRDPALHESGIRFFGAWEAAVEAAGIDYDEVSRLARQRGARCRYPDAESVLVEIRRRHEAGLSLKRSVVKDGGSNVPGDHALCPAGRKFFGSWGSAVKAAGLDPEVLKNQCTKRYPDPGSVIAELLRRKKSGLPLNSASLYKGEHKDQTLYIYCRKYFGSWHAAVLAAGLDPDALSKGWIPQTRGWKSSARKQMHG